MAKRFESEAETPSASDTHSGSERRVVASPQMKALHAMVSRIAPSALSVLILGETGSGKEVLAAAVHEQSPRRQGPYVRLNCAAFGESLLESELFGHERGSFSGAIAAKPGLLESANGGTVFLDELGEMSLSVQAKLLRAIEAREITRVGGLRPRPIDVRFVAATNKDLPQSIRTGRFRDDLYFRLNGITMKIPPLRERAEDIEPLARYFLSRVSDHISRNPPPILSPAALVLLQTHSWPGNARELRNVMERALMLCDDGVIEPEHLIIDAADSAPGRSEAGVDLGETAARNLAARKVLPPEQHKERERMIEALGACAGNQKRAAEQMGMPRRTFVKKLARYNVARPRSEKRSATTKGRETESQPG